MKMQAVRGTQDLLPQTSKRFRKIDEIAWQSAKTFGFEEIDTPIFEFSDVFHRTLGETSDVVAKETYTFQDRGGDSLTLRPEGTAGIARAFISNGLAQLLPLKYYYCGPMFRYERPQKGRYRQFHQFGVECLGFDSPESDVECISLGFEILQRLNIQNRTVLEINSLGDAASRNIHKDKLVTYLSKFEADLSEDSKVRLKKNPLRILDSKDPKDQEILKNAPQLKDFLNDTSKSFFDRVCEGLSLLSIPYKLNTGLVRGLDYYTHTVFEFVTQDLGSQGAVLSGGRYDGLIEQMGGPATPSVGWASGMERIALLLDENILADSTAIVAVIAAEDSAELESLKLTFELRKAGISTELIYGGNVGKKMKKANKLGARWALVIGSRELESQKFAVKDLVNGEQQEVSRDQLFLKLKI